MLELQNISFGVLESQGKKEILKDISLTVGENKFVVITGPNGGGKSTSRLTTVRRGCKRSRLAGIHGEAMYTALTLRSACSHSSYKLSMSGVEGPSPRLSLGDSKGVFSSEREYPLWCRGAHAAPPPVLAREAHCSALSRCIL